MFEQWLYVRSRGSDPGFSLKSVHRPWQDQVSVPRQCSLCTPHPSWLRVWGARSRTGCGDTGLWHPAPLSPPHPQALSTVVRPILAFQVMCGQASHPSADLTSWEVEAQRGWDSARITEPVSARARPLGTWMLGLVQMGSFVRLLVLWHWLGWQIFTRAVWSPLPSFPEAMPLALFPHSLRPSGCTDSERS